MTESGCRMRSIIFAVASAVAYFWCGRVMLARELVEEKNIGDVGSSMVVYSFGETSELRSMLRGEARRGFFQRERDRRPSPTSAAGPRPRLSGACAGPSPVPCCCRFLCEEFESDLACRTGSVADCFPAPFP